MGGLLRFGVFVLYVSCFFVVPLTILWADTGLITGAILAVSFLFGVGYQGTERIARRLKVRQISLAENPSLFGIVEEYCRRLKMPLPNLGVIETPAINVAAFGFSKKSTYLVMTSGAMLSLPRDTLAALVGRQLAYLWHPDIFCESWLSQFLAVMERLLAPATRAKGTLAPRFYPFRLFLKQILLYPLCLLPCYILKARVQPEVLDAQSLQITRLPQGLAEGLRLLQARAERTPFKVVFSARHLFLLPPSPRDPLARIFFGAMELEPRIREVERISGLVATT